MSIDLNNPAVIFIACVTVILWTALVLYVEKSKDPWPSAIAVFMVLYAMLIVTTIAALIVLIANAL